MEKFKFTLDQFVSANQKHWDRLDPFKFILKSALKGLRYLHSRGIMHRDIKPQNIALNDRGIFLIDFGSSKIAKRAKTLVGTLGFWAPEIHRTTCSGYLSGYTNKIDIYSLGRTMMVSTPKRLFMNQPQSSFLELIKNKMMAPKPRQRPSAAEILESKDYLESEAESRVRELIQSTNPHQRQTF
jgi:serine/threonine protein kinase